MSNIVLHKVIFLPGRETPFHQVIEGVSLICVDSADSLCKCHGLSHVQFLFSEEKDFEEIGSE